MEHLRNIREERNLRQIDIANILGINRSTYTSYEIERDTIPINHLNNLCNYFDISIDYAMGLSSKKKYDNSKININKNLLKERLKNCRKENKLTQKEIAKILNTSRSTWTGYEYGKYQIPTLLLYELAKRYNYSMDYLLGKIDENNKI
ncbi:MAG: helix-turn-helix domain-containing protein [Bacilli bacterium]|nr:helix-turn-helix domain-containing protein [Bacilli bacterium]